jgi:hypothetical protein
MKRPFQYLDERVVKRVLLGVVLSSILLVLVMDQSNSDVRAAPEATQAVYLPLILRGGPTATRTATSTKTPTPTATPTLSGSVDILTTYAHSASPGYVYVIGEVQNNTTVNVQYVKVIVDFYNGAQLVANTYFYTTLGTLTPGTKTCFDEFVSIPSNWTNYQFESVSYSVGGSAPPVLTVYNTSGTYISSSWYEIIGLVRNDDEVTVKYVKLLGTLYDASGKVIGCNHTYVNSTDLIPGQSSSFTLGFGGRDYSDVSTWRLQVDGSPQ